MVHRGITIDRYDRANPQSPTKAIWLCGTLMLYRKSTGYQLKMSTAQVFFKYPIVGRMLFRQPEDDPYQDTTVIVEYACIETDAFLEFFSNFLSTTDEYEYCLGRSYTQMAPAKIPRKIIDGLYTQRRPERISTIGPADVCPPKKCSAHIRSEKAIKHGATYALSLQK